MILTWIGLWFFLHYLYSYSEQQAQKGARITMIGILITIYLIIGALASALIWVILIASKRRENKAKKAKHERLESNLFREPSTKPSRFHT